MQIYDIPMTRDLEEITHHGTTNFPIAIYTTVIKENIYGYVPLHWHEEIQFVLVKNGQVKFTVEREEFILKQGEGIFINTGRLHSARSHEGDDGIFMCVDIHPEFIDSKEGRVYAKYVEHVLSSKGISAIELKREHVWQEKMLDCITSLGEFYNNHQPFYEIHIKKIVLELWLLLIEHIESDAQSINEVTAVENQRVKAILEYIEQNYMEKITLYQMAQVANVSRSECCRAFKRVVDSTPVEYLNRVRISKSMYYLKNGEMMVTEIAHEVGFASVSYFISIFKKITGFTPAQFKRSCLKRGTDKD